MWRLARVVKRGLKQEGGRTENRFGRRNAVVKTHSGAPYHISDLSYYECFYDGGPVPSKKKDRNGPFPFPRKDQWVIINVTGATPTHGLNPEPISWMVGSDYWRVLGHCLANSAGISHVAQPGVITLIKDYLNDSFGPTSREEWLNFEARKMALCRQGVTPNHLERFKSYYLLGQPWLTSHKFT